jgi:hypothetical protein
MTKTYLKGKQICPQNTSKSRFLLFRKTDLPTNYKQISVSVVQKNIFAHKLQANYNIIKKKAKAHKMQGWT